MAARNVKPDQAVSDLPEAPGAASPVSHNLNGQRLGRKGRGTRERILIACTELLADPEEAVSMSAVARRASLGMTSLYNYFSDLTELLIAVLEPVMATAEDSYLAMLREPWPDAELGERCIGFLRVYYDFWSQHTRLLHLRNAMADGGDQRMMIARVSSSQPMIALLHAQLGGDVGDARSPVRGMATVLVTGIERTVTVSTDVGLTELLGGTSRPHPDHYLRPEARLMELAIRDTRERLARGEI